MDEQDKQDEWDGIWVRMRIIKIGNPNHMVNSVHQSEPVDKLKITPSFLRKQEPRKSLPAER